MSDPKSTTEERTAKERSQREESLIVTAHALSTSMRIEPDLRDISRDNYPRWHFDQCALEYVAFRARTDPDFRRCLNALLPEAAPQE